MRWPPMNPEPPVTKTFMAATMRALSPDVQRGQRRRRDGRSGTPARTAGEELTGSLCPRSIGWLDRPVVRMYISGMARRYSVAEARAHLPSIIEQAQAGEVVELTRRGRPVAVVLSRAEFERLRSDRPSFGDAYRVFRKRHDLEEVGIAHDFAASVRDRSPGRQVKL
ncbi:type II toxin-antitoxin system Phd/YefM family antitoxin [Sorangium sp. So ce363]|uniref:type II toxin-antitoxin system Phd/YefM family antitoxin n=1 Tax=Sorangium sp. So ce363 TaxID=3133304 RepID=UPI003F5F7851